MKRTSDLSNKTKAELTAMARRKKITVTSGMLKNELVKAIIKGLRKIEAQKKSRTATVKTRKRTTDSKTAQKTPKKKGSKTSRVKTARKPKSIAHKKVPVKAKKAPPRKSKTARSPKTVKSQTRSTPAETLSGLPERYSDHRLVVLARDPNWAYAYWDLDAARVRDLLSSAKQSAEQARWVLRVYSAALHPVEEKGHYFDIDIDVKTGSYYLDLSRPGARFTVEIGMMDASGMFRATTQSNPVILPLNHPSETTAPEGTAPSEVPASPDRPGFTKPPSRS